MGRLRHNFRDEDFDVDTPYSVQKPQYSSESSTASNVLEPSLIEKFTSKLPFMSKTKKGATTEQLSFMNKTKRSSAMERQLPRAPARDMNGSKESVGSPRERRKAEILEGLATRQLLSNAGETLNPLRGEVAQMREQVRHLRNEISTMTQGRAYGYHKSMAQVCVCGSKFLDDALFCRKCGVKRPEVSELICTDCGNTGNHAGQLCRCCYGQKLRDELVKKTGQINDYQKLQMQKQITQPIEGGPVVFTNTVPLKSQEGGFLAELWNILGCSGNTETIEQAQSYGWRPHNQSMQLPGTWDEQRAGGGTYWQPVYGNTTMDEVGSTVSTTTPSTSLPPTARSTSTRHQEPEEEDSPNRWPTSGSPRGQIHHPPPVEAAPVWQFDAASPEAPLSPAPRSPSVGSLDAPSTSTSWRYHPATGGHYMVPFPDLSDEDDEEYHNPVQGTSWPSHEAEFNVDTRLGRS